MNVLSRRDSTQGKTQRDMYALKIKMKKIRIMRILCSYRGSNVATDVSRVACEKHKESCVLGRASRASRAMMLRYDAAALR